jgi:hypothetical protein
MARRAQTKFGIVVEGLDKLEHLDGDLRSRQHQFLDHTVKRLARNIAEKAPGGPERSVGRSIYGRVLTDTVGAVGTDHPGGKALDRGAYMAPKHGQKAVRWFKDGKPQFAKHVRLEARRYFARGLRTRNQVAAQEFEREMKGL